MDYFLARYYSGAQGRFLSPDEFKGGPDDALTGADITPPGPLPYADIGNPQSLNKYTYVLNNPLKYTDPDGHFWDTVLDVVGVGYDIYDLASAPSWGKAGTLGLDVVLAVVPFVPTVGGVKAGVKLADKTIDAVKALDKGDEAIDAVRAVDKGSDAAGVGKKASDIKRMEQGKPPIGGDGKPVELHHPGGNPNGQVQEMTRTEHRGAGNYSKNHPEGNRQPSRIDRNEAARQRKQHWKKRAEEIQGSGQE